MPSSEESMPSSVAELAQFGRYWDDSRPRLLAMLERRMDPALRRRVAPEEILNMANFDAHRRWAEFQQRHGLSPHAWFYRLTTDRLIEEWRKHSRGPRDLRKDMPLPEQSSVQLGLGLVASGTSPSEALVRQELLQRMRQVLELLNEGDREVLWMRHGDCLTHAEVAEVLGITENTATVRYVRALRRLRDLWQQLNPDSEFGP
jgi:RNA polymerase sigma-70 factor (ECF subfamily)